MSSLGNSRFVQPPGLGPCQEVQGVHHAGHSSGNPGVFLLEVPLDRDRTDALGSRSSPRKFFEEEPSGGTPLATELCARRQHGVSLASIMSHRPARTSTGDLLSPRNAFQSKLSEPFGSGEASFFSSATSPSCPCLCFLLFLFPCPSLSFLLSPCDLFRLCPLSEAATPSA